jgi:hypothetical protein
MMTALSRACSMKTELWLTSPPFASQPPNTPPVALVRSPPRQEQMSSKCHAKRMVESFTDRDWKYAIDLKESLPAF